MGMITVDNARLKAAVLLLLDFKYGAGRCKKALESIASLPRYRTYSGQIEPLNEIVKLAKQDPQRARTIVVLANKKREELKQEFVDSAPRAASARERSRINTANHRRRIDEAVATEEIRLGRRFTEKERNKFLTDARKKWKIVTDNYISTHPGVNFQDCLKASANMINSMVSRRYKEALATYDSGKLSSVSERALNKKIRALQKKYQ